MLSKAEVTEYIEEILNEEGWKLYELEFFPAQSTVVQVFVTGIDRKIGLDDCANLTKKIRRHASLVDFFEQFGLEVSSPGLERKLKREEHFANAIGEIVKIVFKFGSYAGQVKTGKLESFNGNDGVLCCHKTNAQVTFSLPELKSAQVVYSPDSFRETARHAKKIK